jgi:CBS domain-containing protein
MKKALLMTTPSRLVLEAETALDLMAPHPYCLPVGLSIDEAGAALVAARVSGAPAVDESGRPVGVLSQTDIVRHVCGSALRRSPAAARDRREEVGGRVGDIMTPAVFSVRPRTPPARSSTPCSRWRSTGSSSWTRRASSSG